MLLTKLQQKTSTLSCVNWLSFQLSCVFIAECKCVSKNIFTLTDVCMRAFFSGWKEASTCVCVCVGFHVVSKMSCRGFPPQNNEAARIRAHYITWGRWIRGKQKNVRGCNSRDGNKVEMMIKPLVIRLYGKVCVSNGQQQKLVWMITGVFFFT